MLFLVRFAFAQGDLEAEDSLIHQSRTIFRTMVNDPSRGKIERGYSLGLLEISRECRSRQVKEGECHCGISIDSLTISYS